MKDADLKKQIAELLEENNNLSSILDQQKAILSRQNISSSGFEINNCCELCSFPLWSYLYEWDVRQFIVILTNIWCTSAWVLRLTLSSCCFCEIFGVYNGSDFWHKSNNPWCCVVYGLFIAIPFWWFNYSQCVILFSLRIYCTLMVVSSYPYKNEKLVKAFYIRRSKR